MSKSTAPRRRALMQQMFDHVQSTNKGKSSILIYVQLVWFLKEGGWVARSDFSNPVRMNKSNLLGHHA